MRRRSGVGWCGRCDGKGFVVRDRPNPVTGRAALGPVAYAESATFRGRTADGIQPRVHERESLDPARTGIAPPVTARRS